MVKRVLIIGLMVVAGIVAQDSSASLPLSTYGQNNGWQGYAVYKEQGFNVVVQYAVYDNLANPGEFDWQGKVEMPPTDHYIYAYQIFNTATDKDVGYFSVLDIQHNPIAQSLMHSTSSQTDGAGQGGVKPDPETSTSQGSWEWSPVSGYVTPGDHSWFLIFSSDRAPVKGTFTVSLAAEPNSVPTPTNDNSEVPEPGSVILLSIATGLFATMRKKKN